MYSLSKFSVTHDELNGGKSVSTSIPCQINWCYTVCKRSDTEVDEMGMGMLCNGDIPRLVVKRYQQFID